MLNDITLVGIVETTIDTAKTKTGLDIAKFRMSTTMPTKANDRTDYHNVVVFGDKANAIAENAKKGDIVVVKGSVQTRSWEDNGGTKRYMTEVVATRAVKVSAASEPERSYVDHKSGDLDDEIPF